MKAAADKLVNMSTERQLCVENHSKVMHCTGWLDCRAAERQCFAAQLMLTPVCRAPLKVGFRRIQFEPIGSHPLSHSFHAADELRSGIDGMVLPRCIAANRQRLKCDRTLNRAEILPRSAVYKTTRSYNIELRHYELFSEKTLDNLYSVVSYMLSQSVCSSSVGIVWK